MARFWVRRSKGERKGWTGSMHGGGLRSQALAEREAQAWRAEGWTASVEESTAAVRAEVRAWERENERALAR